MATDGETAEVPAEGPTTYYRDRDGVLWRERDGWPGEILNGGRWEFLAIDMTDVVAISEEEAAALAGDVPLDGENQGVSVAAGAQPEGQPEGQVEDDGQAA